MKVVTLTDAQHQALLQALAWIDAAGDETELHETMTAKQRRALEQAQRALRSAPDRVKPQMPRGLAR